LAVFGRQLDPQNSEIFRRLLAMAKLKEQARHHFAAICDAPLAAVPTLDDFLVGKNMPGAKTPIMTSAAPEAKPRVAAYIPAYPVVDALNFSAALQRVGDRVELIGRIVEIRPGSCKRGKGPTGHYVFINFGSWRGNIIKISIWSDGLAKLKEQPSKARIGRWVSVTGLMDVPYESKRYGYKHLSITVQEDGQVQQLDEAEAGFRLASISHAPLARDEASLSAATTATSAQQPLTTVKPKNSRPPQQRTARTHKRTGRQSGPPAPDLQPAVRSREPLLTRIHRWMWVIATSTVLVAIVVLVMLFRPHQ
jgi:hypothetical protein